MLLVKNRKELGVAGDALGWAKKENAVGFQGIVKSPQDPILENDVQVKQQVAAGDQIKSGERRVLNHAMRGEDAHLPDFPDREKFVVVGGEPAGEALGRNA